MMADLVKQYPPNHDVTRDLNASEWPRKLLDDLIHHDFNPGRLSLPSSVISPECQSAAILARGSIACPNARNGRLREED